ncbi:hypothetical protein [Thermococcus sp.]
MTLADALFLLDIVFYPLTIVIGVVALTVHLKRGKVHMAKRVAVTLPLFLAYWAWFKVWIPYAVRSSSYAIILFIVTLASLGYIAMLPKIYPEPKESRKDP